MGKFSSPVLHQDKTEITIVERDTKSNDRKSRAFVTETEPDLKPALKELKDKADLLSQFTKRVKKQMRAAKDGPTRNLQPQIPKSAQPTAEKVAGQESRELQLPSPDGQFRPAGRGQQMRTVAIGASSLAEYIPGVQEGAFTALNTDSFTYYAFFARMNEQVRNRWISLIRNYVGSLPPQKLEQLSRRERQSVIEIILSSDGRFETAVIQMSSGDESLDKIPAQSFEIAAPFPNPPRGLVEEDGKIHLKYAFVLQFRPPSFGPE